MWFKKTFILFKKCANLDGHCSRTIYSWWNSKIRDCINNFNDFNFGMKVLNFGRKDFKFGRKDFNFGRKDFYFGRKDQEL